MDPTYPLVPIANFLACVLVLLPLFTTAFRSGSWNIGVTIFALWTAIECVTTGTNAIIWSDNIRNVAPVWCDITTHIDYASGIAVRGCTLVITRRLYLIARHREHIRYDYNKRANIILDLALTLGLPIVTMCLYYIVQETRFAIYEEEGCVEGAAISGLSILLFQSPNLVLPAISAFFYCPRIFWVFYNQRKVVSQFLVSNDSTITRGHYYRMMALGCIDAILTLPLSIFLFFSELNPPPESFWPGWNKVHGNFSTIPVVPASEWKSDLWTTVSVKWDLWITAFTAVVFFALFGLTEDARGSYRRAFWAIVKPFGWEEREKILDVGTEIIFGSAGGGMLAFARRSYSLNSDKDDLSRTQSSQEGAGAAFEGVPVMEDSTEAKKKMPIHRDQEKHR